MLGRSGNIAVTIRIIFVVTRRAFPTRSSVWNPCSGAREAYISLWLVSQTARRMREHYLFQTTRWWRELVPVAFRFIHFIRSSRRNKEESANKEEILSLYRTPRARGTPLFPCRNIQRLTKLIISLLRHCYFFWKFINEDVCSTIIYYIYPFIHYVDIERSFPIVLFKLINYRQLFCNTFDCILFPLFYSRAKYWHKYFASHMKRYDTSRTYVRDYATFHEVPSKLETIIFFFLKQIKTWRICEICAIKRKESNLKKTFTKVKRRRIYYSGQFEITSDNFKFNGNLTHSELIAKLFNNETSTVS